MGAQRRWDAAGVEGAMLDKLESRDRIYASIPVDNSPCLNDALVRHELDVSPDNMSAEDDELTAGFAADPR